MNDCDSSFQPNGVHALEILQHFLYVLLVNIPYHTTEY